MALDFNAPLGGTTIRKKKIAPTVGTAQTAAEGTQLAGAAVQPMGTATAASTGDSRDIGAAAQRADLNMSDPDSFSRFRDELDAGGVNAVDVPTDSENLESQIDYEASTEQAGNSRGSTGKSIDELMEDYIRQQFLAAQNVDTSAGEALINQQMDANIGSGRVNNRAAMGAGGWGQSGMAMAVGADIEQSARQEAEQDILGYRTTERQRAMDNAARGFGLDIEGQRAANEQMILEAKLAALEHLLGGGQPGDENDPANGGGGGSGAGNSGAVIADILNPDGGAMNLPGFNPAPTVEGATAGEGLSPEDEQRAFDSASEASSPPRNGDADETYVDGDGVVWNLYLVNGTREDGEWVKVRTGGATLGD